MTAANVKKDFIVRKAVIGDVAGIVQVCIAGFRHAELSQNLTPTSLVEGHIKEFYHEERVEKEVLETSVGWNGWYVAVCEDEVIGAGGGGLTDEVTAELYVLYLNPTRKREGIGKMLLEAISAEQLERGAVIQEVSVTKGNEMAIPFYEAMGFLFVEEVSESGWQVLKYRRQLRPKE